MRDWCSAGVVFVVAISALGCGDSQPRSSVDQGGTPDMSGNSDLGTSPGPTFACGEGEDEVACSVDVEFCVVCPTLGGAGCARPFQCGLLGGCVRAASVCECIESSPVTVLSCTVDGDGNVTASRAP